MDRGLVDGGVRRVGGLAEVRRAEGTCVRFVCPACPPCQLQNVHITSLSPSPPRVLSLRFHCNRRASLNVSKERMGGWRQPARRHFSAQFGGWPAIRAFCDTLHAQCLGF